MVERMESCRTESDIPPGLSSTANQGDGVFHRRQRTGHGVGPMCKVLPIAPLIYYEFKARQADPERLPPRVKRDVHLRPWIHRVWEANFQAYAARKVLLQLNRKDRPAGCCTVERPMRDMRLAGAVRGKRCKTTVPDEGAARQADLDRRYFTACGPPVHCGQAWPRTLLSRHCGLVTTRGLVHHSGRSFPYFSIRYTERLADAGIEPSVGSGGDAYGNALAESVIGRYKTEVIHKRGPWRNPDSVEFATLEWVDWFNNRRLLEPIGNIPPVGLEMAYYQAQKDQAMVA